jgi:hypothetical protein
MLTPAVSFRSAYADHDDVQKTISLYSLEK